MIIDIYFISAMSSKPERVFSEVKRTILDVRDSLRSESIELLKCLKSWFRLGIFTKEDLYTIIDTVVEEGALDAFNDSD